MQQVLDVLDGAALLGWAQASVAALAAHCDEINALNVFPVADADTGTNLLFTMRAAIEAVETTTSPGASAADVAFAMSRGATTGARGNSGIILSQVIRGVSESAGDGPLTAYGLRDALEQATVLVRGAMSVPVEGTIVTVLDCAAQAARACPEGTAIAAVALAAATAAGEALERTPGQLAVLEQAGAVDAGGLGLVLMLDALVAVLGGDVPHRQRFVRSNAAVELDAFPQPVVPEPGFEVMYLVSEPGNIHALRESLDQLGDSVVIVFDGAVDWSVHVHCADAGAAIEAGLAVGRVHAIRVETLVAECRSPQPVAVATDRAILAVVEGDGMAGLFEAEGATVLRSDDPIDATALLRAIRALDAREVLVLPNGALSAHELVAVGAAAREAHRDVVLLPTASMVQGLAALAVHDPMRIAVDDAFAMSEAAAGTKWGSVQVAPERALTLAGTCEAGDGLGLVGHEVVVVEHDVAAAGRGLVDRVLGLGGEMVTLVVGTATEEFVADLTAHIERAHQGIEVVVYQGGQSGDVLQLGVE